jgi:hypothetical protein
MRNVTYIALALLLMVSVLLNIWQYKTMALPARTDTVETVRWDTLHDSVPDIRYEMVKRYVRVPDSILKYDTIAGERVLPIVQRTYTDDSTYTAYVSGARIDSFPRLDSIITRQRTLERIVTRTVYMRKGGFSVKVRPAVTAGYDPVRRSWGVMAGVAVVPDW